MVRARSPLGDVRFEVALYTVAEAARYLDVKPTTFTNWVKGYTRPRGEGKATVGDPILTTFAPESGRPKAPTIPFVGLVEGMVLAAIRRSGVPLQRVRPALTELQRQIGVPHALASRALYTDGAEVLYDVAERAGTVPEASSARQLVVIRNGQRVFTEVVQEYLQRIEYDQRDGLARLVHLPQYERGQVIVDPSRSFGKPIFSGGGARVLDVLERFWTGESLDELTEEFGVSHEDLEDALRVASRRAA